jgi:hypothetical protein
MSVSCESGVFSGRGLCVGLIDRPEDPSRVFMCPCVWDLCETITLCTYTEKVHKVH